MIYVWDLKLVKYNCFTHQKKFIETKEKYPALVAGYGSGKTLAFCLKALAELGRNPNKVILLAEPVFPMVRDVLQPTLEQCLTDLKFGFEYKASNMEYNIKWGNGKGTIILRSAENWRRWAGLNLAGFAIDEAALLKDDKAWRMGLSRLRDGNHLSGWVATTPEGFNWVWEYWVDQSKNGYNLIQGKTTDNKFLPPEFVESLKENYDEKLINAYINGNFVNLQQGQTYYSFDRKENVKVVNYEKNKVIHIGMDFNINPITATLFHISEGYNERKIQVFDEVKLYHSGGKDLMTQRIAKHIKNKYPNSQIICYPDPAGKAKNTNATHSDHDILRKEGFILKVPNKAPSVIDSVNAVNKALEFTIIDNRCRGLIRDLEQVSNKDGTREIDKSNSELTHFSDGFRYAIHWLYPVRKPTTKSFMA
tara:strand:+ start:5627 stop:6889 length:1263 start_codon:yes stop_codon:yes gene_type:complete